MNSTTKKYLLSALSVFVIFLAWQVLSIVKDNEFVFPNVGIILQRAFQLIIDPKQLGYLFSTLTRVFIVLGISLILSFLIVFIYLLAPTSISFLNPIINILKAAPFAIISVYIFVAFDRDFAPYLISFFVIFPICLEGLIIATDNVDRNIKDELALLDISSIKKYTKVYLPICTPYIVMSILQSFGLGFKSMIMAEYICQIENSMGGVIVDAKYALDFTYVLAWLVIIVIIVCIIEFIIKKIARALKK